MVGAPHVLPSCPVRPRQFSESGGDPDAPKRRRKRRDGDASAEGDRVREGQIGTSMADGIRRQDLEKMTSEEDEKMRKRECPVPKPGGLIAQVMGFRKEEGNEPSSVLVKPLGTKDWQRSNGQAVER